MSNKLVVELEIDPDGKGAAAIKGVKAELEGVGKSAGGAGKEIETSFGRAVKSAEGLQDKVNGVFAGFKALLLAELVQPLIQFQVDAVKSLAKVEDSNRVLRASAKEVGIEYDVLKVKAADFAKTVGQSTAEAQKSYAAIISFAQNAGRLSQGDAFARGIADLAAARGVSASEIPDLVRQLNTLQDEVTDKLLFSNPSAFYEDFARGIGKTAEQLTDTEKRAAVFDATLRTSILFNGEAAKRLDETGGKIDRFNALIADSQVLLGKLTVGTGSNKTPSDIVTNTVARTINPIGFSLFNFGAGATDTFNSLATFDGKALEFLFADNEAKLLEKAAKQRTALSKVISVQRAELQKIIGKEVKNFDDLKLQLAAPKLEIALNDFRNGSKPVEERTKDFENQKKRILSEAETAARKMQFDLQKDFDKAFGANKENSLVLRFLIEEIEVSGGILDDKQRAKFIKGIEAQIKDLETQARFNLNVQIDPLLEANNLAATRQAEKTLRTLPNLPNLTTKDYEDAARRVAATFEKQSETLRKTRDDFQSFLSDSKQTAAAENPFVKLLFNIETAADRAQKRFGAFGDDAVKTAARIETANLNAERARLSFQSQLQALKFEQEAARLELPLIGLTGDEKRRLETTGANVDLISQGNEFNRQAAFFRAANSRNPNSAELRPSADLNETFQRFKDATDSLDKFRLEQIGRGQINDVLREVTELKAAGGSNAAERDLIGSAVLSAINKIPAEILRDSNFGDVRALREFGAQALGDRRDNLRQKFFESLEREKQGELTKKFALDQLGLLQQSKFSDELKTQQFLAITNEVPQDELTGALRGGRRDAFLAAATFERAREDQAAKDVGEVLAIMKRIDAKLSGAGIPVDVGNSPIMEISVQDDRISSDITPQLQAAPGADSEFYMFNGELRRR